ncbi:MAG: amidohydrolase [Chloroflexota bacterium]|nr:amidohydrolase [Chloroflexota bacterium]
MPDPMSPDLILYNGKLHTQDPDTPRATAVAMVGGRFAAVGDDAEIRALAGPDTRTLDLGGRLALPGLIDAHFHLRSWALSRRRLSLVEARSLSDLQQRLAERARRAPEGGWILGQGWNETRWPTPGKPTRADLDAAAPAHPVLLWRSDLHLAVANSRALREAGVDADTPDPTQGRIDRDDAGTPTGILRERAVDLVEDAVPPPSEDEVVEAVREALDVLHRLGLTGVHDHRIMGGGDGQSAFRAYQHLHRAGELALRLWMGIPGERLDEAVALGLRTGFGDRRLRVGHVKLFSDGSQGARTAWMLEPYDDTDDAGMPLTPMDEIAEAVKKADRAGLAVAVHAIGDRANRELISVFERASQARADGAGDRIPHRIEHAQILRPADVQRLGGLGVAASVQPIHITDDISLSEASIGERSRFAYPFRDMLAAGVTLAFGSDAPGAAANPLWGIHAAVTRQRRDGSPPGGWYPEQRLSVAEAVWGFTMGPAIVSGQEADLGAIAPGKLADVVVLDRDIFTIEPMDIHRAQVVMTVFDGEVVYEG